MNLFHCSPHDFYWMHLFTFPVIHLVHFPPPPFPQKQDNPLGYYSCPKRDSRQSQAYAKLAGGRRGAAGGGWTRCIMGNVKIVNSKLLGGAMPLDVTWDQPNFYKTEKKSMYKERTLLNLSTCVSHNTRMAWFVLCGLSSQSAFGRRGSQSVD